MFGWNKTKKHNQNSPTNQKVHGEFNFPLFHSEIWLQSVTYFATQDSRVRREIQPPVLDPILREGDGTLVGHGWVPSWLAGRMSDCALTIPQNSSELPGAVSALGEQEQSPQNTDN